MKKTYLIPSIYVLKIKTHGFLCETSAKGFVDPDSMIKEDDETMGVKSSGYNTNYVEWQDWQ